jgi:hypothetical protein
MTNSEYQTLLLRLSAHETSQPAVASPAAQRERDLHAAILDDCARRGWLAFHGSTAHRTYRTVGEPDFVILRDDGRTLLIECKSRVGKLTSEQLATQAWAAKLGHTVHVVRSMGEFLEVVK